MEEQRLIRKNKDILLTNGYALVILALWSLAKFIICYVSIPDFLQQFNEILKTANIISTELGVLLDVGVVVGAGVLLIFQIFVGVLAKQEATRKTTKGTLCVVMAFVMLIIQLTIIVDDLYLLIKAFNTLFIASVILDTVCFVAIICIIFAVLKNKKIAKEVKT